jgi:hypothetical protein
MPKSRRFDDDDDDDRDPPSRRSRPQPKAGGNTAVKIIAIIGGIFVVICLMCGGLIWYAVHSAKKAADETRQDLVKHVEQNQKDFNKRVDEDRKQRANSDKALSEKAAEAFFQELKGRRVEAAYKMTTAAYQGRVTQEDFASLIEANSQALQQVALLNSDIFAPDSGTTYQYSKNAVIRAKRIVISVTVIKDGATWKVDQFSIG